MAKTAVQAKTSEIRALKADNSKASPMVLFEGEMRDNDSLNNYPFVETNEQLQEAQLAAKVLNESQQHDISEVQQPQQQVDDKFKGKSVEEIIAMYKELESEKGRLANEVGDLRKKVSQIPQFPQTPAPAPQPQLDQKQIEQINNELQSLMLTNPLEFARRLQEATLSVVSLQLAQKEIEAIKRQNADVLQDADFQAWLVGNIPVDFIQMADRSPSHLNFIISQYKLHKQLKSSQAQQQSQNQAQVSSASAPTGVTIQPLGVAAGVGQASRASSTAGARKWKNSEILKLRLNNEAEFQRLYPEIQMAYRLGLVEMD